MRKIGRAAAVTALLSVLCGLFGCAKAPAYTLEDIRSVSVTCGHMDYSHSYSFYLRKAETGWLLDADYAVDTEQPRTTFEACPVTEADAEALLNVVSEQDVIGKLQRCKKPWLDVQVADETTYYTSLLFADGEQLGASAHISDGLVTGFYRLAEQYADTAPKTEDAESIG